MAIKRVISFDWGVVGEGGSTVVGTVTPVTTPIRSGGYSAQMNGALDGFTNAVVIPFTGLSECYYQVACYIPTAPTDSVPFVKWRSGTTTLGGVIITSASYLEVYTGNFATLVATSAAPVPLGAWFVLELHVSIGDSGAIELRVDMNASASFTGDTKPGVETTVDSIVQGNIGGNYLRYLYIDDIVIHDASGGVNDSWPDGVKAILLAPNGDGATKNWTPSTGSDHYALVDENPPSATDYLQATSSDLVDELTLENLPSEALSVKGVVGQAWAFKGSSNPPTQLAIGVDVGSPYYSSDLALGTSQGYVENVWDSNPAGGNWSVSDVNNMKLLLKSRA